MIRSLVAAAILFVAQAAPALAERITLACSRGPGYVTNLWTFDMSAKTVKDPAWDPNGNTHPIRITDDDIYWSVGGVKRMYIRSTSELIVFEGDSGTLHCQLAPRAPRGPL